MLCKYYLHIASDKVDISSSDCLDVSSMVANKEDIKTTYSRSDMSGVVRKCGSTIEFVDKAANLLIDYYEENKLRSVAAFAVYGIENDWTYTKIFECPIDFSSFKYDEDKVQVGCLDSTLASLIKANKSTDYEYPVSEIKSDYQLNYDGVKLRKESSYMVVGQEEEGALYQTVNLSILTAWLILPIYMNNENDVESSSFLCQDQQQEIIKYPNPISEEIPSNTCTTSYFVECIEDNDISVQVTADTVEGFRDYFVILYKIGSDGVMKELVRASSVATDMWSSLSWSGRMKSGEKLQLAVLDPVNNNLKEEGYEIRFMSIDVALVWHDRGNPINIDVISPEKLLARLLKSISGKDIPVEIKGTVAEDGVDVANTRLSHTLLCAAESIRNFKEAKIYTSFNDFCEWMKCCFGYVYVIEEKKSVNSEINNAKVGEFVEFDGTITATNQSEAESTSSYPSFSTSENAFMKAEIVPGVPYPRWYLSFTGFESYQDDLGNGIYRVRIDRLYHDIGLDMFYEAQLDDEGRASLSEYVIPEVLSSDYDGIIEFGGVVNFAYDSGKWNGLVSTSCIIYVRKSKRFFYCDPDSGLYYSAFSGSSSFNGSETADNSHIYQCGTQRYVIVGTSLVKCNVTMMEDTSERVSTVVFLHCNEVYSTTRVMAIESVSGCTYTVDSSRIYSSVNIGYEKQDYDLGNNGNDEFNFSVTYTTGITLKDTKLSLLSPYRADCYGIEELVGKRSEETSSSDSDESVFAVMCHEEDGQYVVDRDINVEGAYSSTVFNAGLAPVYMVEANRRYLASFTDKLSFASSDGNSEIALDGKKIGSDVSLDNPLLGPGNIKFSTDSALVPDDWNDMSVQVMLGDRLFTGALSQLEFRSNNDESFEYELIELL